MEIVSFEGIQDREYVAFTGAGSQHLTSAVIKMYPSETVSFTATLYFDKKHLSGLRKSLQYRSDHTCRVDKHRKIKIVRDPLMLTILNPEQVIQLSR